MTHVLITALLGFFLCAEAQANVYLTWDIEERPEAPVEYIRIFRRNQSEPASAAKEIAKVAGTVREVEDATALPGQTYCYTGIAGNTAGESVLSNEDCLLNPGLHLVVNQKQMVVVSRRANNTSSIISLFVNKDEKITENTGADITEGIKVNYRHDKKLVLSRRGHNNSSIVSVLVNKDEVVMVNEVVVP